MKPVKIQEGCKAGLVCPNLSLLFCQYRENVLTLQANEKLLKKKKKINLQRVFTMTFKHITTNQETEVNMGVAGGQSKSGRV